MPYPTPGAGLRLTREGRKTWFLLYYAPGTSKKRRHYFGEHPSGKLGEKRYLTLKEFEREYNHRPGRSRQGDRPAAEDRPGRPGDGEAHSRRGAPAGAAESLPGRIHRGTVGALLADFLQNHAAGNLTARGYQNYRDTTRTYLAPVFKVPILQFSEDEVRHLLSALTRRAPQCVRSAKTVLNCAFEYGKQHVQGIKLNPCTAVKVTVKKGQRKRFLTDAETSAVFAALPKLKDQKAADVYTLILAAGGGGGTPGRGCHPVEWRPGLPHPALWPHRRGHRPSSRFGRRERSALLEYGGSGLPATAD